jgi:hypothetical protein
MQNIINKCIQKMFSIAFVLILEQLFGDIIFHFNIKVYVRVLVLIKCRIHVYLYKIRYGQLNNNKIGSAGFIFLAL